MAYQPTEWRTGDLITEGKLNNIEAGISSGIDGINFSKVATLSVVSSSLSVRFSDDGSYIEHGNIVMDYNCPDGSGRITLPAGNLEFSPSASIWLDTDPRALTPIITDASFPDILDITKWWIGQMLENYGERIATAGIFRVTWNPS